jgi:putative membrane protein
LVEQSGGLLERFGAAQAAQDGGGAFLTAAAADLGGNIVGGSIKGFFVQLFRAVGQKGGGKFRHFAFAFGVEHAARAFEVDLHIDDGVVVLLDQKDFCAVAGSPALDVHACLRGGGEGEG